MRRVPSGKFWAFVFLAYGFFPTSVLFDRPRCFADNLALADLALAV